MTKLRDFIFVVVFLTIWLSLFFYILLYGKSAILFWILSIASAFIILLQIIYFEDNKKLNLIFIEIFLLFFALQLINVMYAGLNNFFGLDTSYELNAVNVIVKNGYWDPLYNAPNTVYPYPLLHILTASASEIVNVKIIDFVRWLPVFFSSLILVFYFILGRFLFKNKKITLLASLGFIFLWGYVCHSGFGRLNLSLLLFFVVFFSIMKCNSSSSSKYSIVSILLIISILFAHPLARIFIIILLIVIFISYMLLFGKLKFIARKFGVSNVCQKGIKPAHSSLILLAIIGLLAYIVYFTLQYSSLIELLKILIYGFQLSDYQLGLALSVPLETRIFNYGQLFFLIVFFVLIYLKRKAIKNFSVFVFTFFSLTGLMANIAVYLYDLVNLFRLFLFIWPILLLSSSYVIINSNKQKFLSFFILGFICVNIFGYGVHQYDRSVEPDYGIGGYERKIDEQTRLPVTNFEYEGEIVGNHYFAMAFISYKDKEIYEDIDFYLEDYKNETMYSWFFLNENDYDYIFIRGSNPMIKKVDKELYNEYQLYFDKMYSNGDVETYKIRAS